MADREVQVRVKVDTDAIDAAMAHVRRSLGGLVKAVEAHRAPVWRPWRWYQSSERSRR